MKNSKMFSMLCAFSMIIGLAFITNAEPEPCTAEQQCTSDVIVSCTSQSGDCHVEECKYVRCGTVKTPTEECPECDIPFI